MQTATVTPLHGGITHRLELLKNPPPGVIDSFGFQAAADTGPRGEAPRLAATRRTSNPLWLHLMMTRAYLRRHLLQSNRGYEAHLADGDKLFPHDKRDNKALFDWGTGHGYEPSLAGVIFPVFREIDHRKYFGLGYRYVAPIHDAIPMLGTHKRVSFALNHDHFDQYFEPQNENGTWKSGGLFIYIVPPYSAVSSTGTQE